MVYLSKTESLTHIVVTHVDEIHVAEHASDHAQPHQLSTRRPWSRAAVPNPLHPI